MSMSMDVDGIAMFYYLMLMPIVLLPIMVVYFIFLMIIRFFLKVINYKNYNLNR